MLVVLFSLWTLLNHPIWYLAVCDLAETHCLGIFLLTTLKNRSERKSSLNAPTQSLRTYFALSFSLTFSINMWKDQLMTWPHSNDLRRLTLMPFSFIMRVKFVSINDKFYLFLNLLSHNENIASNCLKRFYWWLKSFLYGNSPNIQITCRRPEPSVVELLSRHLLL